MIEQNIPQKRDSAVSRIFSMFSQGSNLMQMGAKGKEGYSKMFGGGETAGGSSMGGGGGGGLSLGYQAMKSAFGSKAPAAVTETAPAAGGESAASFAGPAIALGAAAYDEGKYQQDVRSGKQKDQGPGRYRIQADPEAVIRKLGEYGKKTGLSLTESPDKMSAIERRYDSSGDAMSAIHEAQASLKDANLPAGERRSIYQKLELAKQQGGPKRGSAKSYT
jgi:hypothetical protein